MMSSGTARHAAALAIVAGVAIASAMGGTRSLTGSVFVAAATGVTETSFGTAPDGSPVRLFTLTNANGMELRAITYGIIIVSLKVPDRNGALGDVVVGHDAMEGYLTRSRFFGAVVGRYGNRIANGRFTLDGHTYQLTQNNGTNHLHGGTRGFDKIVWDAKVTTDPRGPSVAFTHTSPDGHEGYPGKLAARVVYTLTSDNSLVVEYSATTDKPTIVNMTQHTYWNLGGDGSGKIVDHLLTINADRFTPVDSTVIPTGELAPVEGTPFDFRKATPIGARIDADHPQIKIASGYDHNYALNRTGDGLEQVIRVVDPKSGRTMDISTTEPGVQFYSANKLDDSYIGKSGHVYNARTAYCLETQHYPDSPNKPNFPSPVVRPGKPYQSTTVFKFGVVK
jgi:aldose 1-epimerase